MAGVVFQDVDALGQPQTRVEPFGMTQTVPGAADIEEVLRCRTEQDRQRRPHHDPVGVVGTADELAEEVLLGVIGPDRLHQPQRAGEIAARRRRADAIVQGHQIAGLRAAAAITGAADAPGSISGRKRR